jgi:hypothetical protein
MISQNGVVSQSASITPDIMMPDLLRRYPHLRPVLDRHGLRGCGGKFGPVETIGYFARAHGVDEPSLLAELNAGLTPAAPPGVEPFKAMVADSLYRRYFLAGIAVTLTAGAAWGAWLLWRIAMAGNFSEVSILEINAHGHAQVFGWVGLFIMGFAYQAFPRLWHSELVAPRLAVISFIMMVIGIVFRTGGMAVAEPGGGAIGVALAGGVLEIVAILIFTGQIGVTFIRSKAPLEPYTGFIFVAIFWFVAMSCFSVWHGYATMSAPNRDELIRLVSTYQAPLRDMQIHGLALLMILGVSMRMLPPMFGVAPIGRKRAWGALGVLSLAVVGEAILFVIGRRTGSMFVLKMLIIPWLMLAVGVAMIALPWKLWRPMPVAERTTKFVRAAYGWLGLSLVMLLLLPVYLMASHLPFSHAYYGAIRHAITVGFVSLMIMGIAGKVVPTLNGIDLRRLSGLWGPFILVNIGCSLRVSLQVLTDWNPVFYQFIGLSGLLELTGLTWWGLHLVQVMRRGKRLAMADEPGDDATESPTKEITVDSHVTDILRWYPQTMDIFDRYGFTMLRKPVLRRTAARGVTVSRAAAVRGICADSLLHDLRHAAGMTDHPGSCGNCSPREPSCHP